MKTRELEDLLSKHADGLNAGEDLAADLIGARPDMAGAASPLLALAHRVQAVLKPIEPSAAFVSGLRAQLLRWRAQPAVAVVRSRPSWWLLALAGVGGLISIASAVVLVGRLVSGGAKRVGEALERRPAPKMRTAL